MQLTTRQDFPASPSAVHAMVTDEAFLTFAAARMDARDAQVAATPGHSAVEVSVASPPEIRGFVGPTLRIRQEMRWGDAAADGSRDGQFSMTVLGTPVSVSGTASLRPSPAGSTVTYAGELTAKVPLMGGRIERESAPSILQAWDDQAAAGRAWLAGER